MRLYVPNQKRIADLRGDLDGTMNIIGKGYKASKIHKYRGYMRISIAVFNLARH